MQLFLRKGIPSHTDSKFLCRNAQTGVEQEIEAAVRAAVQAGSQREAHLQDQLLEAQDHAQQSREEAEALQASNADLREAAQSASGLEQVCTGIPSVRSVFCVSCKQAPSPGVNSSLLAVAYASTCLCCKLMDITYHMTCIHPPTLQCKMSSSSRDDVVKSRS